ncbi:tudor and kh domain-containing protein-like [Plakobranchus ocellatus]|uniref:Tudor and kh domain-containing protein-like n=1 Tax=Plakobranchus ocellatus TaxID=259542 RepID=A0AAV4CG09_9GAST|nr:tudor and kh domain-containing protein-like [Plakobranchus ocellatus]
MTIFLVRGFNDHFSGQNYRVTDVVPGELVAARFEEGDSVYYRAKVLGETADGKIDLYFVDFGDNTFANKQDIYKLRSDFTSFPFQAIECRLANAEPVGGQWSEEAITYFEDLTYCAQWKVLFCRVVSHSHHKHPNELMPVVQLLDTSGAQDVDIAVALVERGFATPVKPSNQNQKSEVSSSETSNGSSGLAK